MLHGPSLVLLWPNQMIFPGGPRCTLPGWAEMLYPGWAESHLTRQATRETPSRPGFSKPGRAKFSSAGFRSPGWAKVFTRLGQGLHPARPRSSPCWAGSSLPGRAGFLSLGWAGVCIPEGRVPETRLDRECHPASINCSLPNQPGTASTDRSLALLPSDPRAGSDR